MFLLLLCAMAVAIATSNYLVQFPLNDWLTVAAFTYPITFVITDIANRFFGNVRACQVVALGFALGVVLSLYSSQTRIAVASGSAFLVAQLVDIYIFNCLRHSIWWRAPIASSAVASCLDTALFFSIAFLGSDIPWITLALGDLAVKAAMIVAFLPLYGIIIRAASHLSYRMNT